MASFFMGREKAAAPLGQLRHKQGTLSGQMQGLGFSLQSEASLQTLTLYVLKSNEIKIEIFNADQVRSSIARRLGRNIGALVLPLNL